MFKIRYFRDYPWWMQLVMLLLLTFTMFSFGELMFLQFLSLLSNYKTTDLLHIDDKSPGELVNAALLFQGMLSVFAFMISSLLFGYLTHPAAGKYLGLVKPGKWIQIPLVMLAMLGAIPVLNLVETWISHFNFGADVKAAQKMNDDMMAAFLNVSSFGGLFKVFLVMAIIPAVGEELFFRGVLLRLSRAKSRSMVMPVLFTAAVFAWTHSNIYGLLSIFIAGVLLALIYQLTGSLWCSIAAHLTFNGTTVLLSYMAGHNSQAKALMSADSVPVGLVAAGLVVFVISFYLLLRNKTPLPADWTDDFREERTTLQGAD